MAIKQGTASQEATVRVMVVEDHEDLRRLLVSRVGREPDLEVVAQSGSLGEARSRAPSVGCDVAVLDTVLPDGYGTDLIAELRERWPSCSVVVMSASMDHGTLARARQAGADEVVDKLDVMEEIPQAIRRLGSGRDVG